MKHARRLATRAFRAKTNEFLAEGPQAVREALAHPVPPLEVFATVEATERHPELAVVDHVPLDVVAEIADAVNPQGVVARCP
ncbi:MAG: RNA methyltransferase, partial [Actinomycetales bacterium]